MRFLIEIAGEDQPALIRSLDAAREALVEGRCHLNVGGCCDVKLTPADRGTETQFRGRYEPAHPQPKAAWAKEPCAK